jgi:asparaginyl-tRNA synthetase
MASPRDRVVDVLAMDPPRSDLTVKGWLRTVRNSKNVAFLSVNDGSNLSGLQVVADEALDNIEDVRKLTSGSAVSVTGDLVASAGKGQRVELKAKRVEVLGRADEDFPIQAKRAGFEFLRTVAHLRNRTNTYGAVFRVRSKLAQTTHRFFGDRGFVYLHTPIITASDAEGAGEMFHVTTLDIGNPPRTENGAIDWNEDFFGRPSFLTVSGQLNAEAFALGMSDVYTFGPTFRAENSNTARHASEFWMIEPEMAFYDLAMNCDLAEDYVKHLVRTLLEECTEDIEFFNLRIDDGLLARLEHVVDSPFERMTYTQAITALEQSKQKFEFPVHWGVNLQAEHERYLTEKIVGRPVFVTDYPKHIKAFYMRRNDDDKTVAAVDLLVPGVGEIIGGSQREERLDVLVAAIEEHGLPPDGYGWYLETRRFGTAPHAGFGLGFERMVMYGTGMKNIRDVIPFPRTPRSCDF